MMDENDNIKTDNEALELSFKEDYIFNISDNKFAGYYRISHEDKLGNVQFTFSKKPKWIHRLFCKWCLGWKWIDKK